MTRTPVPGQYRRPRVRQARIGGFRVVFGYATFDAAAWAASYCSAGKRGSGYFSVFFRGLLFDERITYTDQKAATRRARPRGRDRRTGLGKPDVPGEPPPSGPGDLSFLHLSTRTPAVVEYGGEDAGKTAH